MQDNEYDYKGKRLKQCAWCRFVLPEEPYINSTCTGKHMDKTVRLVQ